MSKTLTVILLFVICGIAAATGGYIAVKQSGAAAVAPATAPTTTPTQQPANDATQLQGAVARPSAAVADAAVQEASATPKPAELAARPSPAPVRQPAPTRDSPRPVRSASEMAVTGRPGSTVTAGAPVTPDPPATPPAAPPITAPVEQPPQAAAAPSHPIQMFEELVVPAESVLGLQLLTSTSTEEARVEDPVEAKVTRDLRVGRTVAIPAGTRVLGSVTLVERGGKVKGKARLGVRFHTLVLADSAATRVPIRTDTIFRESESQGKESAKKIGAAAAGGAILGAIIGGGKGAVIGGAIGAGGGTASVLSGDRSEATLQAGTAVTVRLQDAVTVTIEK